ncbi:3-deoxy-D-manno-octulosonic acid transferase [Muriicola soli]|uniref:3-deoxy-D-manno-octulosonic acid transferase n=1 Tax=Muriicola soli TaxID=2507538 RepID=A0A411E6D7_9FLAO|nr:glycosyltransferase N-terminal domain-containing protein [Muriicola soli]QBA63256.1 3-deoxy-D-manno-octulosonic acid transferase [Muriicola soli]
MYFLYNLLILITWQGLKIAAIFKPKLRLFVEGRKGVLGFLQDNIREEDKYIWVHTASLGEFEQGLPVIKGIRNAYPNHKILVTFFSPSGYEVKKHSEEADLITYLPMDTNDGVNTFLNRVQPVLALFVKYEIWPNYLKELQKRKIPALLISGRFNAEQIYFKWYGKFMRQALGQFFHYFVQDKNSKTLLKGIGLEEVSVSGDTRFDRVSEILKRDNSLDFMNDFKADKLCLVMGSTWPEDEALLTQQADKIPEHVKIVIAPHDIKEDHLQALQKSLPGKSLFYSQIQKADLSSAQFLILDTVGLLTRVYSYADIAYVGGGFATGLHNTLEPAVFGIPVFTGPQYQGFKEAEDLVELGGISVVENGEAFIGELKQLFDNEQAREKQGVINSDYVTAQKGATEKILTYITSHLNI